MDEMSKLWTALQIGYRLSAGYEISVLLIDSRQPARSALPVLKRGKADRGPAVVAGRAPTLDSLRYPRSQQAARLGDDVAIIGAPLSIADTIVRFTSPRLDKPIVMTPLEGDRPGEIRVHLPSTLEDPDAMHVWTPGLYTLAVVVQPADAIPLVSNEIPFALAPTITLNLPHASPGTVPLSITCTPRIVKDQRVLLLFGGVQLVRDDTPGTPPTPPANPPPPADTSKPSELSFTAKNVTANDDGSARTYTVRLRVDGVDSIPLAAGNAGAVPMFDSSQQVIVP
jgi:hypothetical protein